MGAAVLLLGIVTAALLVFSVVRDVAGVTRFTTGNPVEADLVKGEERTIYSSGPVGGGSLRLEPSCQVTDAAGRMVPTTLDDSFTLTLGEEEFRSLARFRVDHDGRYRVSCSFDSAEPIDLAVGPRIRIFRSIGRVFGAGAVGLVALAVAVAIVAFTAVKRHEHRRRARTS